jgi:hypothetical protein
MAVPGYGRTKFSTHGACCTLIVVIVSRLGWLITKFSTKFSTVLNLVSCSIRGKARATGEGNQEGGFE